MSTSHDAFRSLVTDYLVGRGKTPSQIEDADDYMLEARGRIVQLRLGREGTMLVSTMVFYNENDDTQVRDTAIAEFNAYHLFAGGYCLHVDERSQSLYVEQELTVSRFDADGLRDHMEDFAVRATNCARWYLKELAASDPGRTTDQLVFA
ncbi:hypothetical protein C8N35_111100 [Breoghania corrubedonensis]|uniref:Tir chaperone family protein CesT n=1 Tax=Breoghania corrubedonensis TaxID=665038 RepID=A0A2T5UYR6_9HYPH|nr:hypothetical protein [Breoghania corrubedonensis]PTW56637.1 hypothetical protein C8N35_111100 [Breoghania corrubedonensis]